MRAVEEGLDLGDVVFAAHEERGALVQLGRLELEDAPVAVGRAAARLLHAVAVIVNVPSAKAERSMPV